jgi:putative glutathione S-transferase
VSSFKGHRTRSEIDKLNDYIYANLNNGVYQTGFARSQQAYNESVVKVFAALDQLEERLTTRRFLLGDELTEADWRLLPTLARFDVGYFSAFKCNLKALRDYTHLSRYFKQLCRQPGMNLFKSITNALEIRAPKVAPLKPRPQNLTPQAPCQHWQMRSCG